MASPKCVLSILMLFMYTPALGYNNKSETSVCSLVKPGHYTPYNTTWTMGCRGEGNQQESFISYIYEKVFSFYYFLLVILYRQLQRQFLQKNLYVCKKIIVFSFFVHEHAVISRYPRPSYRLFFTVITFCIYECIFTERLFGFLLYLYSFPVNYTGPNFTV